MIKISVPATSANFCIGFDTIGVAFNLYNTFSFDKAFKDTLENFDPKFGLDNNLVLEAYKYFYKKLNKEYIPVLIKEELQDIPSSRGLGSSATCIVAGIVAANIISKSNLDNDTLLSLMIDLEGHPDNVAPAFLGGFITSFYDNGKYYTNRYNVSKDYHFSAFVSNQKLSTKMSRSVLPLNYKREDVVSNISRIINLPRYLENCNLSYLRHILKDSIHEPYRLKLIDHSSELIEKINKYGIGIISGSGSTILGIFDKDIDIIDNNFSQIKVKVTNEGVIVND
jgi:homoserine kinase